MTNGAIFLIIFLVILFLVGIGVGIFFLVRYERKKNAAPTGPSGPSGPSGQSGASGQSNPSGPSNPSNPSNPIGMTGMPGMTGFFAISPESDANKYLTFSNLSSTLTVIATNMPTYPWSNPDNFKSKSGINIPFPLLLTAPVNLLNGYLSPLNLIGVTDNSGLQITGDVILSNINNNNKVQLNSWKYDSTTKKWGGYGFDSLGRISPYALYYNGSNNVSVEFEMKPNLNASNFRWNNTFNT